MQFFWPSMQEPIVSIIFYDRDIRLQHYDRECPLLYGAVALVITTIASLFEDYFDD